MKKFQKGLTMVELMIVVLIVGIIAAVGYPSYIESTQKAKRRDANAVLVQFAQAMERFYSVNYTYLGAAAAGANTGAPAAATFGQTQSPQDSVAAYNLTISAASATGFTVQAAPTGSQTSDDCGTLTLDNSGNRGFAAGAENCW